MRAMFNRVAQATATMTTEQSAAALRARVEFLEHQLRRERERAAGLECALLKREARLDLIERILAEIARRAARAAHFTLDARAELLLQDIAGRADSVRAA